MRFVLLILVLGFVACPAPAQDNRAPENRANDKREPYRYKRPPPGKQPDVYKDGRLITREQFEKERAAEREKARKKLERQADLSPVEDDDFWEDMGVGLVFLTPLLLAGAYILEFKIRKRRSPHVRCVRCGWRGREREGAKLGQETNPDQVRAADAVFGGAGVVLEFFKFRNGKFTCPKCGRGPLEKTEPLAPPPPPRRNQRRGASRNSTPRHN